MLRAEEQRGMRKAHPCPYAAQRTQGFKCRERDAGDKAGSTRCSVTYMDGWVGGGWEEGSREGIYVFAQLLHFVV